MLVFLKEMLSHPFMIRLMITGLFVSLVASIVGFNLVLKRYSMMGFSLSYVAFGVMAICISFGLPDMIITLPAVVIFSPLLT